MSKQFPVRFLLIALALLLSLPRTGVTAAHAATDGVIRIENRDEADNAFSCEVKLSGGRYPGSVFAVLFAESGQMKRLANYPADETVKVALQDVDKRDYIKILWTDEHYMPLASPAVLRMGENGAAAYENFTRQLAESLRPYEGASASADAENPYALARLLVSCDALPDLSAYQGKVTTISGPDRLHILQFYDPADASRCKSYLESLPSVRYVEPDVVTQASAAQSGTSSAPRSWGVSKTGIGEYAESLREIDNAHGVIVAVVDSGVESDHPFLKNRLTAGYDFFQYDDTPQDEHGHGTHVAGTIADCTPGMDVKIMPVRVLNAFAFGSYLSIANGIRYAADHGANIINLSLGSTSHSQTIDDAVNYALSKNITVIVAAGNYNGNADRFCPAHIEDCVTVAAVDSDFQRFERSNYGEAVDIAAPGVEIESSTLRGRYETMSGTSMAAPHVSAAAALLMCERGAGLTPFQISSLLRDAATDLGEPGKDVYFGAGVLNLRPFIPRNFYALLYADGELVFRKSAAPDPDRELVKIYPVAASGDSGAQYAPWHERRNDIQTVTFAEPVKPASTALWFYGCGDLTEIRGLENLDTSEVTDMSNMFSRCVSLTALDLSQLDTRSVQNMNSMFFFCENLTKLDLTGWNTANVADMRDMFIGCAALKTVCASGSFSTERTTDSEGMFQGCQALVGGSGTKYDSAYTDKERAIIDGGTSAPGYFTDKNAPSSDIYAVLYADGELVFQNNSRTDSGRSATDVYKVDKSYALPEDSEIPETPWYGQRDNITTVTFADEIQPASTACWFYDCEKLTEIRNIQRLDTSHVTDMSDMFYWCVSLSSLDVSGFDTSRVTDMSDMFSVCRGLTELDVSAFDTSEVLLMDGMFSNCSALTALDVSGFHTANVTSMEWMFSGCSGLSRLDLSRFDTSRVTSMYGMFCVCNQLSGLDVSGFDTSHVTNMGEMFFGCKALSVLDVSGFNTSGVTDMMHMFHGCNSLTSLDVSGFNTANVENMYQMFYECGALRSIYADASFVTESVSESGDMFKDCAALVGGAGTKYDSEHTDKAYARMDGGTSAPGYFTDKNAPSSDIYAVLYADGELVFQNNSRTDSGRSATDVYKVDKSYSWDVSSDSASTPWYGQRDNIKTVTFADKIQPLSTACWFCGCGNLTEIRNIGNLDTANVTDMSWMFAFCGGLTTLDASRFDTANVTEMSCMFLGCSAMTALNLSRFHTANITNMQAMFNGCSALTALDVSGFDTANVTNMSGMFALCSGLTALDVSKFDTANVTDMSGMFYGCSGLTALDVSKFDTDNVTDMSEMFDGCSGLTALDVSKFDTDNVTDMSGMFYGCSGLTALDASGFKTDNVTDMSWMFYDCRGLTALDASGFKTDNVTNMQAMFNGCSGLTALNVSGFHTANIISMQAMFADCSGLTTLDVSGFDTANVINTEYMFWGCKALTTLDLSDFKTANVTSMSEMFDGCANLKTIYASDKFTTASVSSSYHMFYDCKSLVGGAGTKYDSEHTDKAYARMDVGADAPGYLTDKNALSNDIYAVLYADGELVFQNNNRMDSKRGVTDVYKVEGSYSSPDYAPWYGQRDNITIVTFSDKIQPDSTAYWFYWCEKLMKIRNIENLDTANVTDMSNMFFWCSGLTTLDLSGLDTANVKDMSNMFFWCRRLITLDVSGFHTANVINTGHMFYGCSALTTLDMSRFDTANVTDMSYMFYGCSGLTALDVSGFDTANVTNMSYMFCGCSGLTALDVSGFNTANVTNMSEMFSGCSNLKTTLLTSS